MRIIQEEQAIEIGQYVELIQSELTQYFQQLAQEVRYKQTTNPSLIQRTVGEVTKEAVKKALQRVFPNSGDDFWKGFGRN